MWQYAVEVLPVNGFSLMSVFVRGVCACRFDMRVFPLLPEQMMYPAELR